MAPDSSQRRLAAILSADAVGYSRLMAADEAATVRTLHAHRQLIRALVEEHGGRVVDMAGDNVLAEFPAALEAARCALEIQRVLDHENAELPLDRVMSFRIGIHLGDVLVDEGKIYGDGVNIAARLEALASPGGACISGSVHDQVKTKLAARYEDLGEQTVKNIPDPVPVWRMQRTEDAAITVTRAPGRAIGWRAPALVVALLLAAGGVATWTLAPGLRPGAETETTRAPEPAIPARPGLVVLPFENSGDPEQLYLADGMTEDLITDLSQLSGLDVIASRSSFSYRGRRVDVTQVGSELGVEYAVEGSVRRSGDTLRIHARLVDTRTGRQLWAERYDREVRELFALQDDVTGNIVNALRVELSEPERRALAEPPTTSLAAYDDYLRGVELIGRATLSDARAAAERFRSAIGLDPEFALAYAGLVDSEIIAWIQYGDPNVPLDRTLERAKRAVEIDPEEAQAWAALATAHLFRQEHEGARAAAERAVELAPGDARARAARALVAIFSGHVRAGLAEAQKLRELDPFAAYVRIWLGHGYRLMGRRERAIESFEEARELAPGNVPALASLAVLYTEDGRPDEAQAAAERLREIAPEFSGASLAASLPFADPLDAERLAQGLARVGLP